MVNVPDPSQMVTPAQFEDLQSRSLCQTQANNSLEIDEEKIISQVDNSNSERTHGDGEAKDTSTNQIPSSTFLIHYFDNA